MKRYKIKYIRVDKKGIIIEVVPETRDPQILFDF